MAAACVYSEPETKYREAVDLFSLKFEIQTSWRGCYKDATQQRFKHLQDECLICLETFLPNSDVIVLPCSHGLHNNCFEKQAKQICPYDKTPKEGVSKAHFLGITLLFPHRTRTLAEALMKLALPNNINDKLKEHLLKLPAEIRALIENPKLDANDKLILGCFESFLQDGICAYEGLLPLGEMDQKISKNLSAIIDNNVLYQIIDKLDLSVYQLKMYKTLLETIVGALPAIRFLLSDAPYDDDQLIQLLNYIQKAIQIVANDSSVKPHLIEKDRKFYFEHFKAIKALGRIEDKRAYLQKLNRTALERLGALTTGGGESSLIIQREITDITNSANKKLKFKIKVIGVVASIVLVCAIFSGL